MKQAQQPLACIIQSIRVGQVHTPGQWHGINEKITKMDLHDRRQLYDGLLPLIGRDACRKLFGEWSPDPQDVPPFRKASELKEVMA